MTHPILNLLSDTRPMTGPEILIHFPLCERRSRAGDIEALVKKGEIVHVPIIEQQVRVSAFKLPEGAHVQRTIFDLKELD